MKTKLLLLLLLLSGIECYPQCKKKTDEFTQSISYSGELTKIGKVKIAWRPYFIKALVMNADHYAIELVAESDNVFTIKTDDEVFIKFTDGTVKKFFNQQTTNMSVPSAGEALVQGTSVTIWTANVIVPIPNELIEDFKTKRIAKIRCGRNDYDIKESEQLFVSEQIKCIELLRAQK